MINVNKLTDITGIKWILSVVVYVLLAQIGLLFALKQGNITLFWPAGGFALAILLLGGKKYLSAIFIGACIAGLWVGDSPAVSLAIATGNTLESGAGFWLLKRLSFDSQLKHVKHFFMLLACALLIPVFSASMGTISLWLAGIIDQNEFNELILYWWMGDILGIVFVMPMILVGYRSRSYCCQGQGCEIVILLSILLLMCQSVFLDDYFISLPFLNSQLMPAWIMPLMLWAALRTDTKITCLLQLLIFILALLGAHLGIGYFGEYMPTQGLYNFWLFAMMLSIGGVALAINEEERKRLFQKRQQTQFVMDNAAIEVYWITFDGRIHYVNRQACQALGYSEAELLQLRIPDVTPHCDEEMWQKHWQKLTHEKVLHFEIEHRCENGKLRPIEVTANYVQFNDIEYNVAFVMDTSRRKHAEMALQASEQHFRDLFNQFPDPCWLIENNHFVSSNFAGAKIMGYDAPDLLKPIHPADISPPFQLDKQASREKIDTLMQLAQQEGTQRFEWLNLNNQGQSFPIEVTLSKIYLDHKEMLYCVWRDISEQKRLRQESDRLTHSITASVNEIYLFDAQTLKFIFANKCAQQHLGYSMTELTELSPLDIKPDLDKQQWRTMINSLRNNEKTAVHFQTRHRTKTGQLYPVEVFLQQYETHDCPAYFLMIAVDLSEQKQLEAKLAMLFSAVSAIIWSVDAQLRIEFVSQQVSQILGYNPETFHHLELRKMLDSDMFHPEDKAIQLAALDNLLHHHIPVRDLEHRIKNSSGEWQWMSISMSIVLDENQQLQHIVGVVTNIDSQKRAEEKLRVLNSELDQRVQQALADIHQKEILLQQQSRLAAMGEMVDNIAHQWRQPLNSLAIILMDLEDCILSGHGDRRHITQSVQSCNELLAKMSSTIDDFRHFFKSDKSLVKAVISDVIFEVANLLEATLNYNHIELQIYTPSIPVEGYIFPGELSQALLCLINNAKEQLILNKIETALISVDVNETPDWLIICVTDNAGGIPEQDLSKIFDPYFSTKSEGTGLGLYITKLTIEKSMKGRVSAENTADGACFKVYLPPKLEVNGI